MRFPQKKKLQIEGKTIYLKKIIHQHLVAVNGAQNLTKSDA